MVSLFDFFVPKRVTEMSSPTPRHAFNGRLIFADGEQVRVAISDTGDVIRLLVVRDAEALHERDLDAVILESRGGSGVIRDHGCGEWIDRQTILFERAQSAAITQRRNHVRVIAPQEVLLRVPDGPELLSTYALNLSGGGMLLAVPRKLDAKPLMDTDLIAFTLKLDETAEPVDGTVRVVRLDPEKGQLAVEYAGITARDRERVIKFIFDRQRATIASSRVRWL